MSQWNIPLEVQKIVKSRDENCVYCGIQFNDSDNKTKATWEHIENDITKNTMDNICLSCVSCNTSKGAKTLIDWLENSKYCKDKNITKLNVADIVKQHLD
jgi:5-methylcytosine-specific restriction endonuclease McrA